MERQWSANPRRARELQDILNSQGRLTPKLAWPNLSFVATARGGTSDFYFERFPSYFGDTPRFGAVYSSAEATFSIYPDVDTDGSILAIESGFFEFIPQDQWEAEHPKTLLATEVKVGEYYRLLTTNYSGFYRYQIGNVVQNLIDRMLMTRNKMGFGLMEVAQKDSPTAIPNWNNSKHSRNNITNPQTKAREMGKFFS
ncbi:MAG TPA: GH3 auxin-responsive promoter family protein [Oculatellaceae cyanobacterium]